jgi:hypothetical protein
MWGFFVIEFLRGQDMASGWTYPASNRMCRMLYLTFDAAKDQVDRLKKYSSRKGSVTWAVVNAEEWVIDPVDTQAVYV